MSVSKRFRMIIISVVFIFVYSALIAVDQRTAKTLMVGYCGLVLTFVWFDYRNRNNYD